MTSGLLNEPVQDDLDWSIETDMFKRKMARHDAKVDLWEDNNAKGYSLVLQHCPYELEAELCETKKSG